MSPLAVAVSALSLATVMLTALALASVPERAGIGGPEAALTVGALALASFVLLCASVRLLLGDKP